MYVYTHIHTYVYIEIHVCMQLCILHTYKLIYFLNGLTFAEDTGTVGLATYTRKIHVNDNKQHIVTMKGNHSHEKLDDHQKQ